MLNQQEIKRKLASAVTAWDKKESKKQGYNFHALPQYLNAVDSVVERVWEGLSVEDAVNRHFNDRLAVFLIKALSKE